MRLHARLTPRGAALLRQCEGCETEPYDDGYGYQTIGVGHRLTRSELTSGKLWIAGRAVRYRQGLTPADIDALLAQDVRPVERTITQLVTVPLTAYQRDALILFAFNVGRDAFAASTLLKRLNARAYADVPAQLARWVFSGGVRSQGLANRRALETQLWLGHAWPPGQT